MPSQRLPVSRSRRAFSTWKRSKMATAKAMLSLQRRRTGARFCSRRAMELKLDQKTVFSCIVKKILSYPAAKPLSIGLFKRNLHFSRNPHFNSLKSEINILEGSVMVYGYFISTAHWKYSLFLRFFPWRDPLLRHFSGYPFGVSRKKASTIFNIAF